MGDKDMEVSSFDLINPANSNSCTNSGIFREISVLFVEFLTRVLHTVPQAEQSKQLLTKEICLLSEATTYIMW